MLYGNVDAWYGRPDLFLDGNPLASGDTAGSGASGWGEGFIHTGLYGLTPLSDDIYAYGGLSGIVSGSAGTELFTDESRAYFGVEDAYVGLVGGETYDSGDRLVWNASVGRKRYAIADSMIIGNSASNGDERAALQSNPRWAADMLVLGQLRYNNSLVELFYLDPDELPVVDSRTRMVGLNVETPVGAGFKLGGSYIRVLESDYSYFALTAPDPATATLGREGLEVFNARIRWDQSSATATHSFRATIPTPPDSNAGIRCSPAAMASSGCRGSTISRCSRTATWSHTVCNCSLASSTVLSTMPG
jgi:hypothetical protein